MINKNVFLYSSSVIIASFGLIYTSVPLYKLFCQRIGIGNGNGSSSNNDKQTKFKMHDPKNSLPITVKFVSNSSRKLPWNVESLQESVKVYPDQTCLTFFKVKNLSSETFRGVATYNIIPEKAAQYFNKIQCFCFEEQSLDANESVEMPVLFYIDGLFEKDREMKNVHEIYLSYTFFPA